MIGGVAQRVSSPVLVGRDAEVAQLRAALERAAAGQPAVVVVAGEAGVGKTRLVGELLRDADGLGAVALAGGCLDVGEGVLAYAPIVEALRPLAGALDSEELERVLGGARAELARLVPELGPTAGGEQAAPLAPTRLFELLLGVLHRLAERGPVLLVVEDVHWADQSTRDLLGFLIRNLRAGVALVLTYRSDELHRRHPLRPFLAELDRSNRAERLELGRLGRRELAELVAEILDEPVAPALVGEILERSEGNPFFAEELLAAHLEGTKLPLALRDLLLARVEALSEPTQRVLEVAAVAGTRVDHQLLAAVVGQDTEELVWLLREAVTRHMLAVAEASGAYVFRHALVQEAIYDDLLPVQRGPLHAAYARALERRIEQRGDVSGARSATAVERGQLAYHWYAAHDLGQALLASVQAGQAAALAEAVGHYERALELWDQVPEAAARSPLDRLALLHRAAEAANLAGYDDRSVALARLALDRVDAVAEPLRAGALLERLARYHWTAGDTPQAMAAIERAVATIPPNRHRRSWPGRWPRRVSSSCSCPTRPTRGLGASRRSLWPGRSTRGLSRAMPSRPWAPPLAFSGTWRRASPTWSRVEPSPGRFATSTTWAGSTPISPASWTWPAVPPTPSRSSSPAPLWSASSARWAAMARTCSPMPPTRC
jgi:AAA ATPase domain